MEIFLEGLIFNVLKERGASLSFEDLWATLEGRPGLDEDVTTSTLGSVLASSRLFLEEDQGLWGLLGWYINGWTFRVHPSSQEVDAGTLAIDHELSLFFPKSRIGEPHISIKDPEHGDFTCTLGANKLEGLGPWYGEVDFQIGDDALIKVIDGVDTVYQITRESARNKDMASVARVNREIADLAYQLFPDGSPTLLSSIMREIILQSSPDSPPPDRLPRILRDDARFIQDDTYGLFMLSAPKSALLNLLSDTNRIRHVIDRHRDPNKALREFFGGEPEFENEDEGKKFMEQFMALWNMLKAGPGLGGR